MPLTVIEKDLRKSLRKIGISEEAIRTQEVGDYWRQREMCIRDRIIPVIG